VARRHYRAKEIISKLREAEILFAQGMKMPEIVRELGIHQVTYYRWRKEYGGMSDLHPRIQSKDNVKTNIDNFATRIRRNGTISRANTLKRILTSVTNITDLQTGIE